LSMIFSENRDTLFRIVLYQNIRLSLTNTQRPPLICWT
jgi:hypothetical protein